MLGEGPSHANFMLVGEQPGDKEDVTGKPFVGPAGRVLDQALQDAGIARAETFVTNAVKHFKHEMRRLHKRPNTYEVERCKIWLDDERRLVRPEAVIALSVTVARSLTGSALLRIEDENDTRQAYRRFVAVLDAAAAKVRGASRVLASDLASIGRF